MAPTKPVARADAAPAAPGSTQAKLTEPGPAAAREPRGRRPVRRWFGIRRPLAVLATWVVTLAAILLVYFGHDLPDVRQVQALNRRPAIIFLDRNGVEFARYGDLYGTTVTVETVPRHLVQAVLAAEDRRFYWHPGVDPIGVARALWRNHQAGRVVEGGSTLTQQLVKNLFLSPERTFRRKVQEAMLALQLEHVYSKDQILTGYLNRVYLGAGAYGVDAAARTYFGKPAAEVDLFEAATLAALLKAPSRYAPTNNAALSMERADLVLRVMEEQGYITAEQRQTSMAQHIVAAAQPTPVVLRHTVAWFADWAADGLPDLLGGQLTEDVVVETTLDLGLQQAAEASLRTILAEQGAARDATQAAIVVLGPEGDVRALIGGKDHQAAPFNRAVQALRQPGSSFKPFVYLAALEAGYGPGSLVDGGPVRIGKWSPGNFDRKRFGMLTLEAALTQSVNTVAARLTQMVGPKAVVELARRMGITATLKAEPSLALGTSEVTLLELTGAFATLARDGVAKAPFGVRRILSRDGRELWRHEDPGTVAVPGGTARLMTLMMRQVVDAGTGRAARLDGRPVAGKTGTTQAYRDAWFVGFADRVTTGVWFGNDNNRPMQRVTGGNLPAKLWRPVMLTALGLPADTPPPGAAPKPPVTAVPTAPTADEPGEAGAAPGEAYAPDEPLAADPAPAVSQAGTMPAAEAEDPIAAAIAASMGEGAAPRLAPPAAPLPLPPPAEPKRPSARPGLVPVVSPAVPGFARRVPPATASMAQP